MSVDTTPQDPTRRYLGDLLGVAAQLVRMGWCDANSKLSDQEHARICDFALSLRRIHDRLRALSVAPEATT